VRFSLALRRIASLAMLATALGAAILAPAQAAPVATPTPADEAALRQVIEAQIRAFQRDDGAAAFALASKGIQAQFGTAENFLGMVRVGYPAVYRPRHYRFLETIVVDGQVVQKVLVVGPDGVPVLALYPMVREEDGQWRTAGCYLVPMGQQEV
jgi:hypothetical protein